MQELRLEVFGRVQGVGFRRFVRRNALAFSLKGYVRNLESGSVFVLAQGPRKSLNGFISRVQQGPFLSKITELSCKFVSVTENHSDFVIRTDASFVKDQHAAFTQLGKNLRLKSITSPVHVAIIPDGNRRWAHERGLNSWEGHRVSASYNRISDLLKEARRLGIRHISFWGFSTENWKRDKKEIAEVFNLIIGMLKNFQHDLLVSKTRFKHFGRKDRLPPELISEIHKLEEKTCEFTEHNLYLFLDYGGRDEIVRAVNKALQSKSSSITEDQFSNYLDTNSIPDPDLIIRTSGEHRLSGFMPYQGVYAEYYFTDLHFPEFGPEELFKAVYEFSQRKRRFGK